MATRDVSDGSCSRTCLIFLVLAKVAEVVPLSPDQIDMLVKYIEMSCPDIDQMPDISVYIG
jgi:hypothetical protein